MFIWRRVCELLKTHKRKQIFFSSQTDRLLGLKSIILLSSHTHRSMPGEPLTFCGRSGRETAIWSEPPSTSTLGSGCEEVRGRVGSGRQEGVKMSRKGEEVTWAYWLLKVKSDRNDLGVNEAKQNPCPLVSVASWDKLFSCFQTVESEQESTRIMNIY